MTDKVLVIGAAHLDIVGDYSSISAGVIDKPGEIIYSVGGTGYNIAANLAQSGVPVRFMTLLRAESLITPVIMARLASYGIDTALVRAEVDIEESGFVGQRENGELISAVTASTMDRFSIPEDELRSAIAAASIVVAECNVSSIFLDRIQKTCLATGKKLILACVSEPKVKRILQVERRPGVPYPFFIISMNEIEAAAIGCKIDPDLSPADRIAACNMLGAENIIITRGDKGFLAFDCTGAGVSFPAPVVEKIVSVTGGGDALLSAVALHFIKYRELDWTEIDKSIHRLVTAVLSVKGGAVGSQTHPNELRVVPREEIERLREAQREHFIKAFGEPINIFGKKIVFGDILTIVSIIIAMLALFYQAFYQS